MNRAVLLHLHFEVPDDDGITVSDLEQEVRDALSIAIEGGNAPALERCSGEITLAEEV